MFVRALYSYDGRDTGSLSFFQGDILEVGETLASGWWDGQLLNGPRGWFPSNYVTRISNEEALWHADQQDDSTPQQHHLEDPYGHQRQSTVTPGHHHSSANMPDSQYDLEQELWASLSGQTRSTDDLTSFSQGGDIFAEIAAASSNGPSGVPVSASAMAPSASMSSIGSTGTNGTTNVPDVHELARVASAHRKDSSSSSSGQSQESSGGTSSSSSSSSSSAGGRTHGRKASTASQWEENDFWEPKLNDHAQIYYLNSRTGQTSLDPPREGTSAAAPRGSISAASAMTSTSNANSMSAAFYNNLSLGRSETPTASMAWAPEGWVARATEEDDVYYENVQTGETRWTLPSASHPASASGAPTASSSSSSAGDFHNRSRAVSLADTSNNASRRTTLIYNNPSAAAATAAPPAVGRPQPINTHVARASFYSDESSLDADLNPSRPLHKKPLTPKVSAMHPQSALTNSTAMARGGTGSSDPSGFLAELDFLDPPAPSLQALEQDVKQAADDLIRLTRPANEQSEDQQQQQQQTVKAPSEFDYELAGNMTSQLVGIVKQLLHCTGALDLSVRPSSQSQSSTPPLGSLAQQSGTDESRAALLRPYTKKITSPLNKLVLESRALWGLMSTTEDEESAVQESFLQGIESEEDLLLYRENRAQILKLRAESELQLRLDVAIKAQEILKAVAVFCVFVNDIPPDALGPTGGASNLPALVKRPEGVFNSSVAALLGPGNGYGAQWRGNGFVILPPQSMTSLVGGSSSPAPVPNIRYQYPATEFDAKAAAVIDMANGSALEEVSTLRGAIAGLLSNNRTNRLSQSSFASDKSSGSNTGVLPPSPLQSAQRHVGKIANHATQLSGHIGKVVSLLDDLKIAARVDLEVDTSALSALMEYSKAESAKPKDSTEDAAESGEYGATLLKARQLLASFEQSKQCLYEAGPNLVLAIQSIAMSEIGDVSSVRHGISSPSPSQPRFSAPLEEFQFPARHADPLASILSTLSKVDLAIAAIKNSLVTLLAIADTQSHAPTDARRISTAQRARLEGQRLSQISLNTFDSRGSSGRGTVTGVARAGSDADEHNNAQEIVLPGSQPPSGQSSASSSYFFPSPSPRESGPTKNSSSTSLNSSYAAHPRSHTSSISSFERNLDGRKGSVSQSTSTPGTELPDPMDHHFGESVSRSPVSSKNEKLKKFFGDDSPGPGPFGKSDKHKRLLGADAPPAQALARKGSTASAMDDTPEFLKLDLVEEMSFGVDGQIKGGTLRALVARLTSHTQVDHAYINNFLITYRTFVSSTDLFHQLVERYQMSPPDYLTAEQFKMWTERKQKLVRIRTVNVIKLWLESYLVEGDCEALLNEMHNFAMSGLSDTAATQQILRVVEKRRRNGVPRRFSAANAKAPPPSIVPRKPNKIKFLDLEPTEIARQITIMDSRLCQRITTEECLSKAWPKLFKNECKNITAMIAFNNATTHWVQEVILTQEDTKKRANTIKHFVAVAEQCHKLQNFAGLIDIVAGLTQTPISRLRRTWDLVNQRTTSSLDSLNDLMSPTKHFAKYWEQLKRAGPPCVPFLGVFLTSWTFIGDGMADHVRDSPDQINFAKRSKAAELIQQIELHQSTSYNLNPVPSIVEYLEACFRSDQPPSALWELSLRIEPRERNDEKIARLLNESGFL